MRRHSGKPAVFVFYVTVAMATHSCFPEGILSIRVMSQVWDHSPAKGRALILHLALADHCNDEGWCWPSIATLAKKCRIGERQTQYLIRWLENHGELTREECPGRTHTNRYFVHLAKKVQENSPLGNKRCNPGTEKVQNHAIKGAVAIAPDPSGTVKNRDKAHSDIPGWRQIQLDGSLKRIDRQLVELKDCDLPKALVQKNKLKEAKAKILELLDLPA